MARLPQPGGDNGNWGTILNDYLSQALKTDGTIKDNAVTNSAIAPGAVTASEIANDAVGATQIADGSITEVLLETSVRTKLNQTAPVLSVASKTGAVSLLKSDVGLGNVDNTSDVSKPISTTTQTALNTKVTKGDVAINVRDYGAIGDDATDDTAAINSARSAAITANKPLYFPSGTYKITATLDWRIDGFVVIGDGSYKSRIKQYGINMPVVHVAGDNQEIGGLRLSFDTQRPSTETRSIGIAFGDDTVGSCFTSKFYDLYIYRSTTGMAIHPDVVSVAGLFSCVFENIRILGYSLSGISLIGSNNMGGANCTGCHFDNIYIHNNESGVATATGYPVYMRNWDESVFSQLNIEHVQISTQDAFGMNNVGTIVINSMHIEGFVHTANGKSIIALNQSKAIVSGLSVRFNTFSGSTSNPIFRFFGDKSKLILSGWTDSSNTVTTPARPIVDFSTATNVDVIINGFGSHQATTNTVNGDATDKLYLPGDTTLTGPRIDTIKDTNGVDSITIAATASAVNHFLVRSKATGGNPSIETAGTDANIGLYLKSKGTGKHWLGVDTSGQTPSLQADGPDANHDLNLVSKGTGVVRANGIGVLTSSGAQIVTNKTMTDAANTLSISPKSVGASWYTPGYITGNYYFCNSLTGNNTSATLGNGQVRVTPFVVTANVTITRLFAEFTVAGDASSLYRLGIWNDTAGKPSTLLLDAGSISTGSGNAGTVATGGTPGVYELTLSQVLAPGMYWVGGAVQGVTTTQPTMRSVNTGIISIFAPLGTSLPVANQTGSCFVDTGITGAFTTFTTTPTLGGAATRIGFKVA